MGQTPLFIKEYTHTLYVQMSSEVKLCTSCLQGQAGKTLYLSTMGYGVNVIITSLFDTCVVQRRHKYELRQKVITDTIAAK